ncbi:MAG: glycosyltransferase family 2 protein [Paracoccaceae bacterium]
MSDAPKLSLCIPCYAMGGQGAAFLKHSLDIVAQQTLRDFEVIVADQSDDDAVAQVCDGISDLNIRHIWTRELPRQGSANTNAAIEVAQGEIVKILFQDDFLNGPDALARIAQAFDTPETKWCLTGCDHSRDGHTLIRPFRPRYHDRIQFGKNTVSSPSVLSVRRDVAPRFDENLIWLMDVDYYYQCQTRLGPPTVIEEPLVINRLHAGQVSAGVSRGLVRSELRYVWDKYRATMTWRDWWHYVGRMRKTWM